MNMEDGADPALHRIGGWVILGSTAAVLVLNFALGEVTQPAIDADHSEIVRWIGADRWMREAALAIRFVALATVPLIAVVLASHVRSGGDRGSRTWSTVGSVALGVLAGIGLITNTLQSVAVAQGDALLDQPDLTAGLWLTVAGLFTVATLAWGVGVAAFSEAARRSRRLPAWLIVLGYGVGVLGLVASVSVVRLLEGAAWAEPFAILAFLGVNVWLLGVGVELVRTASERDTAVA